MGGAPSMPWVDPYRIRDSLYVTEPFRDALEPYDTLLAKRLHNIPGISRESKLAATSSVMMDGRKQPDVEPVSSCMPPIVITPPTVQKDTRTHLRHKALADFLVPSTDIQLSKEVDASSQS